MIQKSLHVVSLVFLAGYLLFLVIPGSNTRPLVDYDESIYAQVAKESMQTGSLLDMTWKGNIGLQQPWLGEEGLQRSVFWLEKPPLLLWLVQSGYFVFGVGEFGARVWNIVFALGTVIATYFFVYALFRSRLAAWLAAASFMVFPQFISAAQMLHMDIPVAFFIVLSLLAFVKIKEHSVWLYIFWLALALAVLTKSVIGLFPVCILLLYMFWGKDFSPLKQKRFWYGSLLFLAVVLPWHVYELIRFGKDFLNQYFLYHLFQRLTTGLDGNNGDLLFYVRIIYNQSVAFVLVGLAAFYFALRSVKNTAYALVLCATAFIFVFFSLSRTKLPAYILVVYPFLAALIGVFVSETYVRLARRYGVFAMAIIVVTCVLFFGVGLQNSYFFQPQQQYVYASDSRDVGTYLANIAPSLNVYYYSNTGTKPSIIFYSDRVVYRLPYPHGKPEPEFLLISEVVPDFEDVELLFSTPTQNLYRVFSST